MTLTLTVEVTAEDIEKGEKLRAMRCPVAHAARHIEQVAQASVGTNCMDLLIADDFHNHRFRLPDDAIEFIRRFDNGLPVEPITFEVEEEA